jgi:hypothetical protein
VKAGPPGWQSHLVTHRIDGWIVDPADEDRIPTGVAEMIARQMPQHGDDTVAVIRTRMQARHRKVFGHE